VPLDGLVRVQRLRATAEAPLPVPQRPAGPVVFVGREAELSRLVGALGSVCYVVMGTLAVMAKKRRRTFGTVVRLPSGRIAG
jgi:hypothetical protein